MTFYNRRQFLTRSTLGFAGATLGLSMLAGSPARAANTGGYKALVGIMLKGGIDNNDTILPYDQDSYDALRALRSGIFDSHNVNDLASSRHRDNLLQLNVGNAAQFGGRQFAVPRELESIRDMFNSGELAVVGNVGPLLEPVTRTDIELGNANLPRAIFSHNDQQSTWMALGTEGTRAGWGGQFADAVIRSDQSVNPLYSAITATSPDVFLAGETAQPFRIPEVGRDLRIDAATRRYMLGFGDDADAARARLASYLQQQDFGDHDNIFRRDAVAKSGRGINNSIDFSERANAATPLATLFPETSLGRQLGGVAQAISLRGELSAPRQVFYTSQGGYDTHDTQGPQISARQAELGDALAAFRSAMIELGVWDDVIIFTMSEFGRSMVGNGDGSDHGWGGHHFVAGGSVSGGSIYGDIPEVDLGHPQYTDERGRLIPTTSIEQHASELGRWFGLDNSELAQIFPNLSRFDQATLGFV